MQGRGGFVTLTRERTTDSQVINARRGVEFRIDVGRTKRASRCCVFVCPRVRIISTTMTNSGGTKSLLTLLWLIAITYLSTGE